MFNRSTAPTSEHATTRLSKGMRARSALAVCVAGAIASTVWLGASRPWAADGSAGSPQIAVHLTEVFPSADLRDWVSYSDAFVVVDVTKESRFQDWGPEALAADEGAVGRRLSMTVVDVPWARSGGRRVPPVLNFDGLGWVRSGGRELRMRVYGGGDLALGRRYAFPVVFVPELNQWSPLSLTAVLPVDDSGVLRPTDVTRDTPQSFPARATVNGRTAAEVGDLLKRTPEYPGLDGLGGLERVARGTGASLEDVRAINGLGPENREP